MRNERFEKNDASMTYPAFVTRRYPRCHLIFNRPPASN